MSPELSGSGFLRIETPDVSTWQLIQNSTQFYLGASFLLSPAMVNGSINASESIVDQIILVEGSLVPLNLILRFLKYYPCFFRASASSLSFKPSVLKSVETKLSFSLFSPFIFF